MSIYGALKIYSTSDTVEFVADRTQYFLDAAAQKKVLHVGCTDYPVTESRIRSNTLIHKKMMNVASRMVGIDISEEGIEVLKKHGIDEVVRMDAEQLEFTEKFDLVLAGDVVEHMCNPGLFFGRVKDVLSDNGELMVSVPSAYSLNSLKMWMSGVEQVHKDHVAYYSPKTLAALCQRYGLLPTKLVFTAQPKDEYESEKFIVFRNTLLKFMNTMSPSIIMHFKSSANIDMDRYFKWG